MSDSFNAMIAWERRKPILDVLDNYRVRFTKNTCKKLEYATAIVGKLPPVVVKYCLKTQQLGREMIAREAGRGLFEIQGMYRSYRISLTDRKCDCGGLVAYHVLIKCVPFLQGGSIMRT